MTTAFKQYTPRELYVPIPEPETLEAENEFDLPFVGFRRTGGVFFDTFMSNLYRYGIHNARFHSELLGIKYGEMCVAVNVITGMIYSDFVAEYILLFADDLLKKRQTGMDLKDVASRLGFGTYSGFYHFMVRNRKWEKKRR